MRKMFLGRWYFGFS